MSRTVYARALHLPLFGEVSEEAERGILARYLEGLEENADAAAEVDAWVALPRAPHAEVPDEEIAAAHYRAVVRGHRPERNDHRGWEQLANDESAYVQRVAGAPELREWYDRTFPAERRLDERARRAEIIETGGDPSSTDDYSLGHYIYCSAHVTVHSTGWCTVPWRSKAVLHAQNVVDAVEEARSLGLPLLRR